MKFKDKLEELKDIITSTAANDAYNHAWHATHAYDAIEVDKDKYKYNASFDVASAAFDVADVAIDAAKEAINEVREISKGH